MLLGKYFEILKSQQTGSVSADKKDVVRVTVSCLREAEKGGWGNIILINF